MAEYPSIVLTNAGLDMIAESQAGQNLIFTKLKIGDGILGTGENISTLTALKSPKLDIPIQGFLNQGNGQVRLRYLVDNSGVAANQGFFMREVGIYAKIGESGTEKLYAYTNGGNKVDWIPDKNTPIDAQIFDVFVLIGNAANVTINLNGSATYATKLDLTEHNDDPDAHGDRYLPKSGGTMTGSLELAADPTEDMQAATKKYADENGGLFIWKANHNYDVDEICYSRNAASYKYMECTQSGTTGATEPTWPAVGEEVTDGTVKWKVGDIRGSGMPIGSIMPLLSKTPLPGFLVFGGQELSRATYPQFWAYIQTTGLLISEAEWQAKAAVQSSVGYYSTGDGSTTFRMAKIVDYLRGSDTGREPGTWMADALQGHKHANNTLTGSATDTPAQTGGAQYTGNIISGDPISDGVNGVPRVATETRPKTITVMYCIKAFDATTNQGLIDITALANEMANKISKNDIGYGTKVWVSGEYTPVLSTPTIATHGLTLDPIKCKCDVLLKCITAQSGYSAGDYAVGALVNSATNDDTPLQALLTDTTITAITGAGAPFVTHKTTGEAVIITLANWRYVFRIWY